MKPSFVSLLVLVLAGFFPIGHASAQDAEPPDEPAVEMASLPATVVDGLGYSWDIQGDGTIKDGTRDAFDDGLRLTVNGVTFPATPTARLERESREVVLGPTVLGGIQATRRIFISPDQGFARYLEVLHNETTEMVEVELSIVVDLGSDSSTRVVATSSGDRTCDPQDFGVVTDDGAGGVNDAVVVTIYSSPGSSNRPVVSLGGGQITLTVPGFLVPPRSSRSFLHVSAQRGTADEAREFLSNFDPESLISELAEEERDTIWNFGAGVQSLPPIVLPRRIGKEVLELASGDSLQGEVPTATYRLVSRFGEIEIPTSRLAAIEFGVPGKSLDRVVLESGSIYSGRVTPASVHIDVPSTGNFEVPGSRIARLLFRLAPPGETPVEPPPDAGPHLVALASGDRYQGTLLAESFTFHTRLATTTLQTARLARVHLTATRPGLHQAILTDGSTLTGFLAPTPLAMRLDLGYEVEVSPPEIVSILGARDWQPPAPGSQPSIRLADGDVLAGRPEPGAWALETAFGEVQLRTESIASAEFPRGQWGVVRVRMWDDAILTGRLLQDTIQFRLASGLPIELPPAHLQSIEVPFPELPVDVAEEISNRIDELGADDWATRQKARSRLLEIGRRAIPILTERAKGETDPEIANALDSILKELAPRR